MKRKAPIAIGTIVGVILLAGLDVLPISVLSLMGVAIVLITRVLTPRQAYRASDWPILVLIAGMIALGHALENSGAVGKVAETMCNASLGPRGTLFAFYALAMLVTATVSTKASAVLLTPVAITLAATLGVEAKPFVMAVAFASSTGFATPIGFQTNLMVLGPGGYFFKDFIKFGLPLNIIIWLVACLLIPIVWPF